MLGLKTEYECRLIQEHCRNLQVSNFKNICNDQTFSKTNRLTGGGSNGSGGYGNNHAMSTVSTSVVTIFTSIIAAIVLVL